ncbi:MAG: response regulator [Verrucomicrobiota bacterium]
MLEQDDLKWIATTSTELNSTLEQVARYADLARRQPGAPENEYIQLLSERVEYAARSAQELFDRVTARILERSGKRTSMTPGFAMPSPAAGLPGKEATESANNSSEFKVKNPNGAGEYILVVDDEPEIADLASEMLADEGYKVIIARDGFEALKVYRKMGQEIGLIILDFFLPVMDGDAVFEELKAVNPSVRVVLSSGFAEQNKIGAMLAQGLRGFIPKPYTREKLLAQVRTTLEAAAQRPSR